MKLSKSLFAAGVAVAFGAHPASAQVPNTWDSASPWNDTYQGITWDKSFDATTHQLTSATTAKAANWMADLPGNMFVAHVSIPGAHDFATGEDNWASDFASLTGPSSSVTQSTSMREQMDRGIRGIDFRPGLDNNALYCNHGIARTTKKLETAVEDMITFLQKHPTEFFVVHFFRGNVYNASGQAPAIGGYDSDSDREIYNSLMKELFETKYDDYVVNFRPNLTVEEARGKMVLFTRDRISFVHLDKQARITNWTTEYTIGSTPGTITNELNAKLTTNLHHQDISEGNNTVLATKQQHCKNLIEFSQNQHIPVEAQKETGYYTAEWVMNFTSIDNSGSSIETDNTNGYKGGASVMNPDIANYITANLGRGPLGVFFSDYVLRTQTKKHNASSYYTVKGDELVYKIIENNFTGGDDAPVVRYAISDSVDWDAVPANPFGDNPCFIRNVQTGLFLSSGADWGTHAVVEKEGIRFTLKNGSADGVFTLNTTQGANNGLGDNWYVDNGSPASFTFIPEGKGYYYITLGNTAMTAMPLSEYGEGNNSYPDGTQYMVDGRELSQGNAWQLWEVIDIDKYFKEQVAEANEENPVDVSYMVRGHRFLPNDTDNSAYWPVTTENSKYTTIEHSGTNAWNDKNLLLYIYNKETISGLGKKTKWNLKHSTNLGVNGKYKVRFKVALYTVTTGSLTFKINGETISNSAWDSNNKVSVNNASDVINLFRNDRTKYTVEKEIDITNGILNIEISKGNNTSETAFFLDDVELIYLGTPQQNYSNFLQKVINESSANIWDVDSNEPEYMNEWSDWYEFLAPYKAMVASLKAGADISETDVHAAADEVYAEMRRRVLDNARYDAHYTGCIINNSFEWGTTHGWTVDGQNDTGVRENANATYHVDNCDGNYLYNTWNGGETGYEISQTISGVNKGVYEFSALLTTDGGSQVEFFVNDRKARITAERLDKFEQANILLPVTEENATIRIGSRMVDHWFKADNFHMTLLAPYESLDFIVFPTQGANQLREGDTYYIAAAHAEDGLHVKCNDDRGLPTIVIDGAISETARAQKYILKIQDDEYYLVQETEAEESGEIMKAAAIEGTTERLKVIPGVWNESYATVVDESGNVLGFHEGERTFGYSENHSTPAMLYSKNDIMTGIDDVMADEVAEEGVYYNLQGVRVQNPASGIYIKVTGNKAQKVILK